MTVLEVRGLHKSFGGLRVTADVSLAVADGERRLIIGPNGAGKTTLFNLITGELRPDAGSIMLFGDDITRVPSRRRAHLGLAAHLSDHHAVPARHAAAQRHLLAARRSRACAGTRSSGSPGRRCSSPAPAPRSPASASIISPIGRSPRPPTASAAASRSPWRSAQNPRLLLLDEPFAGLSIEERRDVQQLLVGIPRDVTIVMIEHDMDIALEFAERITVLHFGEVIVEGTRAEVVAHPRTKEIYLGE